MAKLRQEVQLFIVQQLACFREPSEVVEAVAERFNLTIDRRQAWRYHPDHSPDLAEKWRVLFDATRDAYIQETAQQGIAHQAFRLAELQALYRRAKSRGNDALAARHLRQAAEEVGGLLTNRRELSGKGGAPLPPSIVIYLPENGR